MIEVPLRLRHSGAASVVATAWLIPGDDPATWLDEVARWDVPMAEVALYALPAPIGILAVPPRAPRETLRALPYASIAGGLYYPSEARIEPPLREEEARRLLDGRLLVLHPAAGSSPTRAASNFLVCSTPPAPFLTNRGRRRLASPNHAARGLDGSCRVGVPPFCVSALGCEPPTLVFARGPSVTGNPGFDAVLRAVAQRGHRGAGIRRTGLPELTGIRGARYTLPRPSTVGRDHAGLGADAMDTTPTPSQERSAAQPVGEPPRPPDLRVGSTLGKYRIAARLGQGGMGVVYEAEDTVLERRVALKLLTEGTSVDAEARDRFRREARAAAKLTHPNVVTVYDVGRDGGVDFIAMELVRGRSVQALLDERRSLTWEEATWIVADVCRGLAAAHEAGLIHRDIKPANVMLAGDGTAKLADFGLVRAMGASCTPLTGAGVILGTPHYMSPEQCRAEVPDERSDVYALGATYYELLCGRTAYPAGLTVQIMFAHCSSPVPDPRVADRRIPERCAAIVLRAMAKLPADRYPSARAMLADLQAALGSATLVPIALGETATRIAPPRGPAIRVRRAAWIAGVLGVALLTGLVAHGWNRPDDDGRGGHPVALTPPGQDPTSGPPRPRPTWAEIRLKGVKLDLGGHAKAVAFSRVGDRFATGACDGRGGVVVWDLVTGEERLRRWEGVRIHAVAFSPDGSLLAAAGDGEIRLWDFGWQAERTLPGGEEGAVVCAVVFSHDGRLLFAGLQPSNAASEPRLRVSDVARGTTRSVPETCVEVNALAVSPDGRTLASGAGDGTVSLWSLPDVTERRDLATGLGSIWGLSFSADGSLLAVGGDTDVQLWVPRDGTRKAEMHGGASGEVFCLAFSPARGPHLASGGGRVVLWDAEKPSESGEVWDDRADAVFGIAISPDGSVLATACWDGVVRLRDVTSLWK